MPATVGRFSHAMCALVPAPRAVWASKTAGSSARAWTNPRWRASLHLRVRCRARRAGGVGQRRFHLTPTALPCGSSSYCRRTPPPPSRRWPPRAPPPTPWPAAAAAAAAWTRICRVRAAEQLPCSAASGGDEDHRRSVYVHWLAPPGAATPPPRPSSPSAATAAARAARSSAARPVDAAARRRRRRRPRRRRAPAARAAATVSERCAHATHFAVGRRASRAARASAASCRRWGGSATRGSEQLDRRRVRPGGAAGPQGKGVGASIS